MSEELEAVDSIVIQIMDWHTPATDYPLKRVGTARIERQPYVGGYYNNWGVNGYEFFEVIKPIPITELQLLEYEKWDTWMVDDPPHWWAMQNYARNSIGNVLVAGLGLGLIVHALFDNIDVDSITVVEINKDVIDLIFPFLPKSKEIELNIINENFYEFINETNQSFDRIILDIWTSKSKEDLLKKLEEEVKPLVLRVIMKFPESTGVVHGFGLKW